MPARMKANGNFSDASVELFYSVSQNKSSTWVAPVTACLNFRWFTDTFS